MAISPLPQLSKQPRAKKRLCWQAVTWRTPRGNCRTASSWTSRRQTPSRNYSENFRSCRRSLRWLRRNKPATGAQAHLQREVLSLLSQPGPLWAAAQAWESKDFPWGQLCNLPTWALKSVLWLLFCFRKRVEELSSELSEALRKLENSDKEKRQLQKTVAEQDMKMNDMLDRIKLIQHQV